jgi:copper chaperone CopZ
MDAQHILESAAAEKIERFRIRGMHCANCATTIEKAVAPIPGVIDADVKFRGRDAHRSRQRRNSRWRNQAKVASAGYSAIVETGVVGAGESVLDRQDARRNLGW